jgi:hypothetical protein
LAPQGISPFVASGYIRRISLDRPLCSCSIPETMMLSKIKLKYPVAALACAAGLAMQAAPAFAQTENYPNRPIKLIVSAAPGGTTDITARMIADPLGRALGQSIVVDNKPGGAGTIAAQMVKRSAADGYTLLLQYSGYQVITPLICQDAQATGRGGQERARQVELRIVRRGIAAAGVHRIAESDGGNQAYAYSL